MPSEGCASKESQARLCIRRRRPPRAARRRGPARASRWRHVGRLGWRNPGHREPTGRLPPGHRGRAARADPGNSPGGPWRPLLPPLTSSTGVGETRSAPGAPGAREREPSGPIELCPSTHALRTSTKVSIQAGWCASAGLTPIKPLAISLNRCETPPATRSLLEPPARSWALCGPRVPSSGAGTGSRCRWSPRRSWSRVTPPPRADNPRFPRI